MRKGRNVPVDVCSYALASSLISAILFSFLIAAFFVFLAVPAALLGQSLVPNPVPFISQPLMPDAAVPGGGQFTLTVNGSGFSGGATVYWNGVPLTTNPPVSSSQVTAIVPAANIAVPGTASVTVVNPTPGGGKSNVVFFTIIAPSVSTLFTNAIGSPLTVGSGPLAVAVRDFNADGKLDMAVANSLANTVTILLGKGDGTFTQASGSPLMVGTTPQAISVGDFNGDGNLDLAVANNGAFNVSGSVSILLGNGDGTFTPAAGSLIMDNGGAVAISAGDFNRDGKLDLAVGGAGGTVNSSAVSGNVTILLGNGDGTFTQATGSPITEPLGADGIAVGDFDKDGKLDLAVLEGGNTVVDILRGNGDGTFTEASGSPMTVETDLFTVALGDPIVAGDFDGDGNPDLAVTNGSSGDVTILLGKGDGTFGPAPSSPGFVGTNILSAAVGDFNGDNKLELAVANGNSLTILLGNGDGTFTATASPPATGTQPSRVGVGDFNGDGRLDFATPNEGDGTVSILLQQPPAPVFSASPSPLAFESVADGRTSTATLTVTNAGSANLIFGANALSLSGTNATDFAVTSDGCSGQTVAAGAVCTVIATFTPSIIGGESATLTFQDNAADSPQQVTLTGTGLSTGVPTALVSSASITPLDFGTHDVGTTATPQTFPITNTGTGPLGSLTVSVVDPQAIPCNPNDPNQSSCNPQTDGSLPYQFTQTNDCPSSLAAGANCTITVTYRPLTLGAVTGTLVITDDTATSPLDISLSGTASPVPFAKGEVFLGVGNGKIQRRSATGDLIQVIDTGVTGHIAGMAFDSSGNLYAAAFGDRKILEFDSNGNLLKTFADYTTLALVGYPESILFDGIGNAYVGNASTGALNDTYIYEFDPSGSLLYKFNGAPDVSGTNWIELAADQCTIYYTSLGISIKRYNVCTQTQLPDFTDGLDIGQSAYALRIRPDGDVLVADSVNIYLLDSSGNIVQTYSSLGSGELFGLNLDPDGTSFWTADLSGTQVYKIDIATGNQLVQYTVFSPEVAGITVKGEINVATTPAVTLSPPTRIDFGSATVDTTSSVVHPVTLTNSGNATLTFSGNIATTGTNASDFGITSNTCGTTLAAGSSCGFNVTFTPSAIGTRSAAVSIADNAADSPQQILLTGTGVGTPAVTLSATSLTMPDTPLNMDCPPRVLTITNSGNGPLSISNIQTSDSAVFAISGDTCPVGTGTLAAGDNCQVSVTFHPTVEGTATGSLTITSNAPVSPPPVSLTGTGKPPCPLAAAQATQRVLRGADRTTFTVEPAATCQGTDEIALACVNAEPAMCAFNPGTIQNPQKSLLTMANLRAVADSIKNFQVTGTSADAIQRTLYLQVLFSDFSFTAYPTQAAVAAGGTASYALSIVPVNGLTGQVALSCAGAPAGGSCTVTPSAVNVANGTPVQVRVKVQTSSGALAPVGMERRPQLPIPGSRLPVSVWILAMLLGIAGCRMLIDSGWRLAPKVRLAMGVAVLAAVAMWGSCGGGGTAPPVGVERSMRGTYTIVVTGTVAPGTTTGVVTDSSTPPLEHQVKLTLQVQ